MNAPVPSQRGRSARNNRSAYSSMRFSSNSNPLDVLLPWLIIPRKVPNFSFRMLPYDPRQLGSFAEHTINYVKQEDGKAKVGFRSFPCPNYDRHRHQVDPLKDDCPLCRAGIAPRASVLLNVLDTNLANNPPPGAGPWRADGSLSWSFMGCCACCEPAAILLLEKRIFCCARRSNFKSSITNTNSMVANCAAAMRLSITSQALYTPAVKV